MDKTIGKLRLLGGPDFPVADKTYLMFSGPGVSLNMAQLTELHTALGDILGYPRLTLGISEEGVIERWNVLTKETRITYELSREEAVIRLEHALRHLPLIDDGTTDLIDEELLEFIRQNRLDPELGAVRPSATPTRDDLEQAA